MGEVDQLGGDADAVPVEVDEAEPAVEVGVPEESGHFAVRTGDDQIAQRALPGGIRPDPGDDGERHGKRAHHPLLDVGEALAFVPFQPLGELPQSHDCRIVREFGRYGLQLPSRGVAAHHLSAVEADLVVAGRDPPHMCLPALH